VKEVPEVSKGEEWADWLMSVTRHYLISFVADPKRLQDPWRATLLSL